MHELSIALSILDLVEEETARRATHVAGVHVRLGPLSGVVPEALLSAYELAREGTSMADTELIIEEVPIVVACPSCVAERTLTTAQELRCPVCSELTPEVLSGRELEVVALELAT